jgi:hypothetical protein
MFLTRRAPTQQERDEREVDALRKEEKRLNAERRAAEEERLAELRALYRSGEPSSEMTRIEEQLSWLHTVAKGRWTSRWSEAIPIGGEEPFNRATAAARDAVTVALAPMIADAERDLERATEERDRFARGR